MKLSTRDISKFSGSDENLSNLGSTSISIEPSNEYVTKAVDVLRKDTPEVLTNVTNIKTDYNGDAYGQYSSALPHTVHLNMKKIEQDVRSRAYEEGENEEQIIQEIVRQTAIITGHESGHQHAYTERKDSTEGPAEQKEKEVQEKIDRNSLTSNFRHRIFVRADLGRNVIYTAIILDEADKKALFGVFPPKHKLIQDGHVTLQFRPGKLPDDLGKEVVFQIYGYSNDDKADAVAVKLNDVSSNNSIPHITLSVNQGVKPSYSNELLSRGYEAIDPLTVHGKVAAFIGGQGYITKLPEPPKPPIEPMIGPITIAVPKQNQINEDTKKTPEI